MSTVLLASWGTATPVVYLLTLTRAARSWRIHRDVRSYRDLLAALTLFVTAIAASIAYWASVFVPAGVGLRAPFVYAALAAFTAAGVILLAMSQDER
jgi:MFS superfamily sulfate permease-like transporter